MCIKRKEGDKTDRTLVIEIEIDHLVGTDKDKTFDPTIGDSHKTDSVDLTEGKEVIHVNIMTVEIEGDQTLGEASVIKDMTIGIGVVQEKEA